jgi:DNA-binding MarR family transcriptional regulator
MNEIESTKKMAVKAHIYTHPGTHPGDVARDLGISYLLALYHCKQLALAGEIEMRRQRKEFRLYPAGE